jgi:mono/diheme cytochrome c family protein
MRFQALFIAAGLAAFPASAWAIGNPQAGQELVLNDCTSCHGPSGANVHATAPQLGDIAKDHSKFPDWMHAWLSGAHHAKLHMNLSHQQLDDVMAYLGTFQVNQGNKRG